MDTKPIFDFIFEIKNRKHYVYPPEMRFADNHAKAKCSHNYFVLLSRMEEEFEACVFQCVAESPAFKEELHIIADKIGNMVYDWKHKQSIKKLGISPYGDSKRVAIQVGEKSLRFLQVNYDVEVKPEPIIDEPKTTKKSVENNDVANETPIISGTDSLAKYLGCSKSMAFSIIKNGVLKEQGIQYMVGKCWKFNRELLRTYLQSNPNLLSKIRCKK